MQFKDTKTSLSFAVDFTLQDFPKIQLHWNQTNSTCSYAEKKAKASLPLVQSLEIML